MKRWPNMTLNEEVEFFKHMEQKECFPSVVEATATHPRPTASESAASPRSQNSRLAASQATTASATAAYDKFLNEEGSPLKKLKPPAGRPTTLRDCNAAGYRMDWDWFKGRFGQSADLTEHERKEAEDFFRRLNLHIRWANAQAVEQERLKQSSEAGPALQT